MKDSRRRRMTLEDTCEYSVLNNEILFRITLMPDYLENFRSVSLEKTAGRYRFELLSET